ncbi:acyltransferase [Allopusillimonas soli]|uniref:Acyltransferase family protein n=1 Tax=Allopusillimonas soli TaxID=659016 RepID=A0A853FG40_9BURK|nr:acyltransferase family protein [Allopusillimonas soli]NYT38628.1 acyltransferase family protein [Allopusillimonas soli]
MQTGGHRFSAAMDMARVVACFMVVLLHVAALNFHSFDGQWWASNFYDSLTRSCVPLFLMITGVLLLGRQEPLPAFLRKRFLRILPPLLFWSLFYMTWNTFQGEHYGPWYDWLRTLANGPVTFHLWYLYAIVGIYLFVPFLRKIWHATGPVEKKTYLALWALVSAWPTVKTLAGIDTDLLEVYGVGSFFGLVGYLFLGAYVRELYMRQRDRRRYWLVNVMLFALFSSLTMLATYAYSRHSGEPDPLFYDYLSPFVLASSFCAFNVLYGLGTRVVEYAGPLKQLSACTLGVYCIHIFILQRLDDATPLMDADNWWSIPVMAVCVFLLSMAAIMALRRFRPFEYVT